MNTPNPDTHPHLFRRVRANEILLDTDIYKVGGQYWDATGQPGDTAARGGMDYYRRIPEGGTAKDNWISVEDRLPTATDYGDKNQVLAMNDDGTADVYYQDHPGEVDFDETVTHWKRITPPVKIEKPIKVGEHKVEFRKDGSLKVGCTEVPKKTMEEIVRRWKS